MFEFSGLLTARILYLYNYNSVWFEFIRFIGSWLLRREKQYDKLRNKFASWKAFSDFPDKNHHHLFRMFNPAIRNALVHGEFYVDDKGKYTLYSLEFPDYSPFACRIPVMELFMTHRYLKKYFLPDSRKTSLKLSLAKYWINAMRTKDRDWKHWENDIAIIKEQDEIPLEILMKIRSVTAGSNLLQTKRMTEAMNLLHQKLANTIGESIYQALITLVITGLYVYSRGKMKRERFLQRELPRIDNFKDINTKNKIIISRIMVDVEFSLNDRDKAKIWRRKLRRLEIRTK
ncbi:MAG: hypothetical protein ACTSP4_01695 [Candidatus Hodarchaeales archaeon]